jgi:hypothetical protein
MLLAGIAACIVAAAYVVMAPGLAGSASARGRGTAGPSDSLVIIQGIIQQMGPASMTIRTPMRRPYWNGHGLRSHLIIAGRVFLVKTAGAVFQLSDGTPVSVATPEARLSVGDRVVIGGGLLTPVGARPGAIPVMQAQVIEHPSAE